MFSRTNFYIKFPGRDLGGPFALFKGYSMESWTATVILLIITPAILEIFYFFIYYKKIKIEDDSQKWNYFWNLFVMFGAFSQQVNTKSSHC